LVVEEVQVWLSEEFSNLPEFGQHFVVWGHG
jgi:hypothetical protein